jgi:hypothetical protein
MPNNEPRKIKTLAVKGDAAENGGAPADATAPVAKPAAAAPAPETVILNGADVVETAAHPWCGRSMSMLVAAPRLHPGLRRE